MCIHRTAETASAFPVDLTDSVRLERSLVPRPAVYLAVTEDLVEEALALPGPSADRRKKIEQFIAGEAEPTNLPVVLVSARSSDRTRGRYEWDDLRRDTSLLDRLAAGPAGAQPGGDPHDDVILLEDDGRHAGGDPAGSGTGVLTRTQPRVRVIPQGIFDLHELAARIAIAGTDEEAVIDAIRTAPHAAVGEVIADAPWRVIVPCPVVEAADQPHAALFTGLEGREPAVMYGTAAGGLDASVEEAAPEDLFPSAELARAERGAAWLVAAETLVATAVLLCAWVSGGLAVAARDHAVWLEVSLLLAAAAIVFAALPWFITRDSEANMNDTFDVRRVYASRTALIGWACAISVVLFVVALMVGVGPVLATDVAATSSTSVTFETATSPVLATIQVDVANADPDATVSVDVQSFPTTDATGSVLAHRTALASQDGTAHVAQQIAMPPTDRYLTVAVAAGDAPTPTCTPTTISTPGCTIVAIPASDTGTTTSASSSSNASATIVAPSITSPSPAVSVSTTP